MTILRRSGAVRVSLSTLFLSVLLSGNAAYAAPVDLMALWQQAQIEDGEYLAAKHRFLANQEGRIQARAELLPTLSFQYEYKETDQTINDSDNTVYGSGSADYPTETMGITLTQSIFDYGRWQRYSQSKASVSRAEAEFELAEQQLMLRLSESYFLVLERQDQLQTVQDEKAAMSKHLTYAEKKLRSGLGRRVDVEDAQARYLNALAKEVELQSRLMDAKYALREVVGMVPSELVPLGDNVPLEAPAPASATEWVSLAVEYNLELQAKMFALQEAEKEVKALRSGHYPTLDLVYANRNTDTDGSIYGGGSDVDTSELSLQLNVPIYAGGGVSSRVRQSLEKQSMAQEELKDQQRMVERSAHDAYYRITAAIVQIGALEQSVVAQERMLQSKSSGYRTGKNSILEVLDAQQDLSTARQALTKAKYDYVLNILRLKYSAGGLLPEDLRAVNAWLGDVALVPDAQSASQPVEQVPEERS